MIVSQLINTINWLKCAKEKPLKVLILILNVFFPPCLSLPSHIHAGDEDFRTEFKVPPFQDCVLSFLGFSAEEKANMEERTVKHGQNLRQGFFKNSFLFLGFLLSLVVFCPYTDSLKKVYKTINHNSCTI